MFLQINVIVKVLSITWFLWKQILFHLPERELRNLFALQMTISKKKFHQTIRDSSWKLKNSEMCKGL